MEKIWFGSPVGHPWGLPPKGLNVPQLKISLKPTHYLGQKSLNFQPNSPSGR